MADNVEFKHISLSDDEDEVVIQAGVAPVPEEKATVHLSDASASSSDNDAAEGRSAALGQVEQPSLSAALPRADILKRAGLNAEDISEEARKEYEQHMRRRAIQQEGLRMETTEEDLHAKMPFVRMQRTIVVVLLLLIVAAIVYWFVRHPLM